MIQIFEQTRMKLVRQFIISQPKSVHYFREF